MDFDDTIVAIATPPGRGGIGVVRLAGPQSRAIALPMLRLKHDLEPGRAVFGDVIEPKQLDLATGVSPVRTVAERIDEVVVTYFAKPHSYTTDDIIEISAHGSPVVLQHIVELAVARGARLAEPGEFTMRAFLNGRIDLTQAEAVRDLIDSQTLYQAKVAAQQLEGALSHRLKPIKQKLVELIALLDAGVDFAEDDVAVLPGERILQQIAEVHAPLEELARSFAFGKIVHEGLTLAIVGRPNVGKSSLFNRLVERDRAIVTATPGTTRDLVSETVSIGGIPVKLVDTAGLRQALDEAESIGIRKSMEALADADLVLVVFDCSQASTPEDKELLQQVANRPAIVVANKCDLATGDQEKPDSSRDDKISSENEHSSGCKQAADDIGFGAAQRFSAAIPASLSEGASALEESAVQFCTQDDSSKTCHSEGALAPEESLEIAGEPRVGERGAANPADSSRAAAAFISPGRKSGVEVSNAASPVRDGTCSHTDSSAPKESASPARIPYVRTSAITGEGIPELRKEILRHVGGESAASRETGFLTNLRHEKLVRESLTGLDAAQAAVHNRVPHEMLLLDLYNSLRPLDDITGATTTDDILNLIFSTFCIGK